MIELEDMKSFAEVVDSGGFTRAARRLGLSKSIVSRRVAKLEAELGTRLLSRTTHGVSPTEAGLDFKARGDRILAEFEEAREAMAHHKGDVVGRLRVAAPVTFGTRHVAPLLAEMAERHPRLEIDLSLSDRQVDLVAERFDAAVRIGNLEDSSLVARRIAPVRSALVASPDYLAEYGYPETPQDLVRHQCLDYVGRASADWSFRSGKRWVAVRPRSRLRADNGETILQWAIAGAGIAELPTFLLSDAIESHQLVPVLRDYPPPEHGLYVLRPPGHNVPGKVRALIDLLVAKFGGEPVWDGCMMKYRDGSHGGLPVEHEPRADRVLSGAVVTPFATVAGAA
jgi:DNA-binding transcriptional LysR family regulator